MYKWVDQNGVTHFTQEPPPADAKSGGKIDVKTQPPNKPAADNWREREQESKAAKAKQGLAAEQAHQKEESQRAKNCARAQDQADTFSRAGAVYRLNDKGERVYYEDKEREAKLAEAKENMARYCR
jgi:hypothetical protein